MYVAYATVLTAGFAPAALALARSLIASNSQARVFFFCLDDEAERVLRETAPQRCAAIRFPDGRDARLEGRHRELPISAYCWLMKPLVIDYLMRSQPDAEWCCYVDSDMLAFADPSTRFRQAGERSIVVTPHAFRYPEFVGTEYLYGFFNAGFIAFRQNAKARAILDWWSAKCLAHCPARPEPDSFGDQKYVEQLVDRFRDDVSVGFPFLNCAAWNIGRDMVCRMNDTITWRGFPILMYHFQGLKVLEGGWVDLYADEFRLSETVRELLYRPYVAALRRAMRDIEITGLAPTQPLMAIPRSQFLSRLAGTIVGRRNLVRW